ncbi:MAG TPA: cytochrome b/b6 domain-containing protein [Acetobacteraceae bacterium]|nr:cytochrome b/b6 domain-containing protein [Acetobacteraceae bacterium]
MDGSIATQPAETQGLRHNAKTIALHWITAALVALLWCIGQTVDFAPNGPLRVDYRSVHIVLGVALGLVLIARLVWRATRNGMLPPLDHGVLLAVARITHWLLYLLLIIAIGFGIANVWVRGDSIFNLFRVPQYDPGNRALVHLIGGRHALFANAVLIVAGLHAAAALFHHYILRDATLRRMLPWAAR